MSARYISCCRVQLPCRALPSTGRAPQAAQTLSSHGPVKVIWVTGGPSFQRDCNKNASVSDKLNVLLQDLIYSRCCGSTRLQAPWKSNVGLIEGSFSLLLTQNTWWLFGLEKIAVEPRTAADDSSAVQEECRSKQLGTNSGSCFFWLFPHVTVFSRGLMEFLPHSGL